jgi:transcriptional regulator with GAF, ATPase, and Fis domain
VADGGTLFLDEVGELPLETQVKLLRALQERELERLGSSRPIRVDVRVIAATNRNLAEDVKTGRFRADLFYRLNVFPIHVPPLRERLADVPLIVGCVLGRIAAKVGKPLAGLSEQALGQLRSYRWPGNVRELLNVVEHAAILSSGPRIEVVPALDAEPAVPSPPSDGGRWETIEEVERRYVEQVLEHTGGVIQGGKGAATILGLHPNTLRSRMQKLGIRQRL